MNAGITLNVQKTAHVLKLLGDKTRLTMMKMLQSHECCVCEFTALFDMSQPAISQHLRKMKDAGIVQETRRGQWIFYSLNPDSEYAKLIEDLLNHLPDQQERFGELEAQGRRISCE
ncbi:ArsR/SmtB family transcription factor [Domibacillus iocasae]|uniref:Transcriptional regulator n=1 Tax=Domibacillus iocasae TaxID=1714016 RepID=A0A1E7DTM3_9BACI|nr:metalloregulator ArsR/SmtB family transcription factor [Domibacillus iocasae]OES46421.1 transcriptional regulator [Domibacillus iocasae]